MNQHAKRRAQRGYVDEPVTDKATAKKERSVAKQLSQPQAGARELVVDENESGLRLDKFLANRSAAASEALSRSRLQALVVAGDVTINGARAKDNKVKVTAGQTIAITIPEAEDPAPAGEDIALSVVYEDEHLIIIDKPAGLVVHPAAGHASGTLVNALIAHCGESLSGIGGVKRPGIVHRLDKDTSGLMVAAKTDAAFQGFSQLFADHGRTMHLIREYNALVWGAPVRMKGVVDVPIGRHPTTRDKQAVVRGSSGKQAITHWQVLEKFDAGERENFASLLSCILETGRTHQIRVHMDYIKHPVMGDRLYGTGFKTKSNLLEGTTLKAFDALGRQALHAARFGFMHPVTGEELEFESALPDDMQELVDALRN